MDPPHLYFILHKVGYAPELWGPYESEEKRGCVMAERRAEGFLTTPFQQHADGVLEFDN